MAKKKLTRKELLKGTDEFLSLSARAAIFVNKHSRQFVLMGAILAVIALIYLGITTYLGYVNRKGQDTYNIAYYTFLKNMNMGGDQKKIKQSEELFKKVIEEYGLSKAARLALPEIAYLKFLDKKYDEAISMYEKFIIEESDNSPYQSLASIALAACYEEKKDFKRAIEILRQITAGSDDYFKEQAMLHLARVYRLSNQEDKSLEILKEFIEKFKTSPLVPIAKAHIK
ncbi:MAG: tetratricopeptide repeat protein [Thermodesulfobacteriota bacterium]|nr:tetratricopeptide repeat protein [Thermodesulfobacteriota bacterium]